MILIPQYKPKFNREGLAKEINDYILKENGYFTEFEYTKKFEKKLAEFLGVKYCFTTSNGTISLSLALLAYGVKPGDIVLVPNITMIATCNAVKLIGAIPIFCDIDPENTCLDLENAKDIIRASTVKAVIYVTLNGRCHSIEQIDDFKDHCMNHSVRIVFDNAQALGCKTSDRRYISCFDDNIGSFSFSMPKIITTGQGGCLVCNYDYPGKDIKRLRDFGREKGGGDIYDHFGINCKFTEMQAIMGLNQLNELESRISDKKYNYALYWNRLSKIQQVHMKPDDNNPYWFIDIYVRERDQLAEYLAKYGIETRKIYPELSMQKCNNSVSTLTHSQIIAEQGLWLPSSIDIKLDEIDFVCERIKDFYA